MQAIELLEKCALELAARLSEIPEKNSAELSSLRALFAEIRQRPVEEKSSLKVLKDLAFEIIEFNKLQTGLHLPVPPYDLWLPFKASNDTRFDSADFGSLARIINHMVAPDRPAPAPENERPDALKRASVAGIGSHPAKE